MSNPRVFLFALLLLAAGARASSASEALPPLWILVGVEGESTLTAAHVQSWPQQSVRITSPEGEVRYVPAARVQWIRDSNGVDQTKQILRDRGSVGADPGVRPAPKTHSLCFRPSSSPECRSFVVFNIGVGVTFAGEEIPGTDGGTGYAELGWMRNVSHRNAAGASLLGLLSTDANRLGVRARYRRWVSRVVGVDGTAGLVVNGGGDGYDLAKSPGWLVGAGVQAWGQIGVAVDVEKTSWTGGGSTTDWRVSGYAGSELGVLVGLAAAIFIASFSGASF